MRQWPVRIGLDTKRNFSRWKFDLRERLLIHRPYHHRISLWYHCFLADSTTIMSNRSSLTAPSLHILFWLTSPFLIQAFDPPSVFPVSVRQALVDKSKELYKESQPYTTAGWSNRAATPLTPVSPQGIYTADRPFLWNTIDVGCRGTIIELPSDNEKPDLWVHAPVGLDGPLRQALQQLGTVKHVVSPNYEHVKFAPEWSLSFPDVYFWGCPGLMERVEQVKWTGEVPYNYRPPSWTGTPSKADPLPKDMWDTDTLQALHLNMEHNPFTGKPFFNEVIYYHVPSKTLLTTDLFWNYPAKDGVPNSEFGRNDAWELAPMVDMPWKSLFWKTVMDDVYYPFFNAFMIKDRDAYREIAHHILNVWDVETVIPAHGDILRGKDFIKKVLKEYFKV